MQPERWSSNMSKWPYSAVTKWEQGGLHYWKTLHGSLHLGHMDMLGSSLAHRPTPCRLRKLGLLDWRNEEHRLGFWELFGNIYSIHQQGLVLVGLRSWGMYQHTLVPEQMLSFPLCCGLKEQAWVGLVSHFLGAQIEGLRIANLWLLLLIWSLEFQKEVIIRITI